MIRTILFVDDDPILCSAVEMRLREYRDSFGVITAKDGFEAVQLLKTVPVSLVVVDLIMPRMDGMSLITHLHQNYPDLPVIIASSHDEVQLKRLADESGAIGFLIKPYMAGDLAALITEGLAAEAEGGIMNDVSPSVFMQLIEMDARTCTIRILDSRSQQGGILYFNQGQLFDARTGDRRGIDAAHQIFSWDRTTIYINNRCPLTENRIDATLGSIIMKAAGMKDESEERPADYNETASIASNSDEVGQSGSMGVGQSATDFEVLRRRIEQLDGVDQVTSEGAKQELIDRIARIGDVAGIGKLVLARVEKGTSGDCVLVPTRPVWEVKTSRDVVDEIRRLLP